MGLMDEADIIISNGGTEGFSDDDVDSAVIIVNGAALICAVCGKLGAEFSAGCGGADGGHVWALKSAGEGQDVRILPADYNELDSGGDGYEEGYDEGVADGLKRGADERRAAREEGYAEGYAAALAALADTLADMRAPR